MDERAEAPLELRMYLLATGDRGIGYSAVYGSAPLTIPQFLLLEFLQQTVLKASSEEGADDLRKTLAIRREVEREERERAWDAAPPAQATGNDAHALTHAEDPFVFDPETMDAETLRAWIHGHGGYG